MSGTRDDWIMSAVSMSARASKKKDPESITRKEPEKSSVREERSYAIAWWFLIAASSFIILECLISLGLLLVGPEHDAKLLRKALRLTNLDPEIFTAALASFLILDIILCLAILIGFWKLSSRTVVVASVALAVCLAFTSFHNIITITAMRNYTTKSGQELEIFLLVVQLVLIMGLAASTFFYARYIRRQDTTLPHYGWTSGVKLETATRYPRSQFVGSQFPGSQFPRSVSPESGRKKDAKKRRHASTRGQTPGSKSKEADKVKSTEKTSSPSGRKKTKSEKVGEKTKSESEKTGTVPKEKKRVRQPSGQEKKIHKKPKKRKKKKKIRVRSKKTTVAKSEKSEKKGSS